VLSRCVFADAGVAPIDIETRKTKEEMKLKEVQARAIAEHGQLALITVEGPHSVAQERVSLRPPMLQVEKFLAFYFSVYIVCGLLIGVDGNFYFSFQFSRRIGHLCLALNMLAKYLGYFLCVSRD
jgi:hypothetical protein